MGFGFLQLLRSFSVCPTQHRVLRVTKRSGGAGHGGERCRAVDERQGVRRGHHTAHDRRRGERAREGLDLSIHLRHSNLYGV